VGDGRGVIVTSTIGSAVLLEVGEGVSVASVFCFFAALPPVAPENFFLVGGAIVSDRIARDKDRNKLVMQHKAGNARQADNTMRQAGMSEKGEMAGMPGWWSAFKGVAPVGF
jgi:hypothetical protein